MTDLTTIPEETHEHPLGECQPKFQVQILKFLTADVKYPIKKTFVVVN